MLAKTSLPLSTTPS